MQENLLISIHRIFVKIRSDIRDENNIKLIEIVRDTLISKKSNTEMIQLIMQIENKLPDIFRLEDKDDSGRILSPKEEEIFVAVFCYSANLAFEYLSAQWYDAAYDIVDGMHVFPEIILGANKKSLEEYWDVYIEPIRKKWNPRLYDEVIIVFK